MHNHASGRARRRIAFAQAATSLAAAVTLVVAQPPTAHAATTVTTTYGYTGTNQTFTVPDGVSSLTITLKGGQGGLGGGDSQGSPTPGGYQGVVTGTIAVTPGQVLTIAVGGGGGTGTSSAGSAPGGTAGQNPLAGYDGAVGGVAGPEGSSGGGGGGGAATVLQVGAVDVVAGGAGGNGGNGQFLPIVGRRAEEAHTPRPDATSTTGRPGLNTSVACSPGFRCDGGASGAGGGGAQGGERGQVQYGGASATEYFGFGGYPGANSTAGFADLSASYDFYAGNNANGSIVISYDDGAPGAPQNLAGTTETNAVGLSWNAPATNGASAITDYKVEYATNVNGPYTVFDDGVSAALTADVTGLVNGTTYFFRVSAINAQGAGATATTSVGIVPSDVPSRPIVTALTPFGAGLYVDFTPGATHSPITGYEYRLDGGTWQTGSVSANRMSIAGLVNGRSYSVEIRALNVIGASLASTPAQVATPRDIPLAPTDLLATGADQSIAIDWNAPASDNGSAITDYLIETATSTGGPYTSFAHGTSTATEATIGGLTNGTTYYVRVAAVNGAGTGARTSPVVATPYTTPNAPAIALAPADGALTVAITPGFDGGSARTGFEYRIGASGPWQPTGSSSTTFTIAGLANGTAYDVEVRSINAAGASPASSAVSGTPRTTPAAPAISAVALDTGGVSVSFTLGADGGSALTNVQYSIDGGSTWITPSPASVASPLTITGLTGGQTYPVRLRAVNAAGTSTASNISTVTAKGTPDAPSITVDPVDTGLVVSFSTPANGGVPITNYDYSTDGGDTWATRSPASTVSPLMITGLTNGTTYSVAVRAVNSVGNGPASGVVDGTPRTTPGTPSIVGGTIVGVGGDLDVDFTAPTSDGGSSILTYQYSTDGGATWRDRASGTTAGPLTITTASSDGITLLVGGQVYPVEIRAVNAAGTGVASAVADGITTTAPLAPEIASVITGDGTATVTFTPSANGGAAITAFEYRLDGGSWIDTGSLAGGFVIAGLTNGTTYGLELRAVNAVGAGEPTPIEDVDVFTTPGAPGLGAIVPGDGTLSVSFASGGDGGSAITTYQYSTDGGVTWRTRTTGTVGSPLLITVESGSGAPSLTNAELYAVQLRAVNAAGTGAASETKLVAPRGAPAAPTGLVVDAGNGSLVLTFTPGADNGSSITAYEYQLDGGSWVDAGSLSSPITIIGLANGVEYDVVLRARNAIGAGAGSTIESSTPRTTPGAPGAVEAVGSSHEVAVEWSAPASDGGAEIIGYTASLWSQASGGVLLGSCIINGATSCAVSGLVDGVTVYADVVAINAAGSGSHSSPRVAATPLSVPSVEIASITPSASALSVAIDIHDVGGAPITAYEYQLDGGDWHSAPSTSSPFTITGLTTGTLYSVRIRATNAAGTGSASAAVAAVPHTTPGAPTSLSATSGPASASLTWSAPSSDGGRPVTDYVVQYATSAGGTYSTFADGASSATTANVTGLTNGTTYYFRVAAVNTAGQGGFSSLASTVPLSAPSAPTVGVITPGSAYLSVAFTVPSSTGGSPIIGYEYRLDGGTWRAASGSTSPIMITGLENGQSHSVELRAVNAVGGGTASNAVVATPYGLPGAVVGFRAAPTSNSVVLEWDAADDNGSAITNYSIYRWTALTEGGIVSGYPVTTTGLTQTIAGLSAGTYYFTVEANNAAGAGPRSAPRTTATVGATLPSAPSAVTASVTATTATMSWTAPAAGTSAIVSYITQYSTDGSTWTTRSSGSSATSATFGVPSATPYQLRVAAISASGVGPFTTVRPALASTGAVSSIGATSASISGTVNANAGTPTASVEYATSAAELGTLAATIVAASPSAASGSADTAVNATLTGLTPGTRYFARTIASGAAGTTRGATVTFTTDASIVTSGLELVYTGLPAELTTVTQPADLDLTYVFEGIDGTVYPASSTPPVHVGTYEVTITSADELIEGSEVVTIAITPKPVTVGVSAVDRAYDGTTDVELIVDLDGVIDGDDVTVDANQISGSMDDADAGAEKSVDVTVGGALLIGDDAADYEASLAGDITTVTITKATQTLAFTSSAPSEAVPGDTYTPTVSSSADLDAVLSIDSETATVCALSGGTVTFSAAGTCVLIAAQAGTADVDAATDVQQSIVVTAAALPAAPSAGLPAALNLSLSLEAGELVAGSMVLVTAEGLEPNTEVRIEMRSDLLLLGTAMTDGNGSLTTTVTLPNDLRAGTHRIVAVGKGPDGSEVDASTALYVDWSGALAATATSGGYTAVTATRILDTRLLGVRIPVEAAYEVAVPAGLLPDDVTAVELNLTVTESVDDGFVTVYPCGSARPWASAINFSRGETKANLVGTRLSSGDELCLWSSVETHVVVDFQGYHSESTGSRLVARTAVRLVDTRPGGNAVEADGTLVIPVLGRGRAPEGSSTVTLNVAVDRAQGSGFLTVFPCGTQRPWASNLNFVEGQTVSNEVMVAPGNSGTVCVYSNVATDLIVDLNASYDTDGGTSMIALVPGRLVDTRRTTTVPAGDVLALTIAGADDVDDITAVALNIAVTQPEGAGYLTVFPCGVEMPLTSNLNFAAGQTISNHVTASIGDGGQVCIATSVTTHIVVDVEGVYRPPT